MTKKMEMMMKFLTFLLLLCCFQLSFAAPTTPTSDFIDNGDGTVTHKTTGLIWMRCAMGQTWDKATSNCTGTAATYTWDEAKALKTTFAGKSDWRLPNMAELVTIVERENVNPAINTTLFPNMLSNYFWSSSPYANGSNDAWIVNFSYGDGDYGSKGLNSAVRLVRMGQWIFGFLPSTTPTVDFTDNQDGTVTHKRTGLMWQRCSVGQTWTGSTCTGTAKKYTYTEANALKSTFAGQSDWRLPNQNELLSIVEFAQYDPAINTTLFPNAPSGYFWSSSPAASSSGYAWIVDFYNGYDGYSYEGYYYYFVRLVRSGQCLFCFLVDLPNGTIGGDSNGWVDLLSYGNVLNSYQGVTASMNYADGTGNYLSQELATRFAKTVFHLGTVSTPDGNQFAAANKGKTGYIETDGKRTDIVMKYYPSGSTTPPMNGSIISQTSPIISSADGRKPGHVAIAKKVVKINANTLDVYLFEQNWLWLRKNPSDDTKFLQSIADSRKMRFTKATNGGWKGQTAANNVAIGWLNPEAK
jgi:hypothetical protein